LQKYTWARRKAAPLFDADITENNRVLLPFLLLGDWLDTQGSDVEYISIPTVAGRKTGIDDYLAKHGKEGFDKLKREAWNKSEALEALRITALRTTEGGLASLFALQYSDDVRYDNDEECWYAWNGILWTRQPRKAPDIQERVKESVGWILDEANKVRDEARRKSMRKWGINCDQKRVIRSAMDLASSDSRLRVSMDQLDKDALLLGTLVGIVDLRTGKTIKAARENLVTRSVAVEHDAAAKCPRWERFISEIMLGEADMVAFMQRFVGYLLVGGNPLRLIFFLYGIGRNGKSVFIETLLKLMGDYGEPAKSELIMKHRADRDSESAQPFMLKLRGKRYITASEVGEGMQLDAAVVKTLTGGDAMTVRGLHADD
jgi:putative DNA primase/helicase